MTFLFKLMLTGFALSASSYLVKDFFDKDLWRALSEVAEPLRVIDCGGEMRLDSEPAENARGGSSLFFLIQRLGEGESSKQN